MSDPENHRTKANDLPKGNRVEISPVITTQEAKVIRISGAAGDTLERHKVNDNALLLVKKGRVRYAEGADHRELAEGEGHGIPAEVYHAVTCITDAEVFVVIPIRAKIKFER